MDNLKAMKEQLISCVQGQMSNIAQADTKELGEAIDMIKDLSEAVYYCSIVEAMEESEKEKKYNQQQKETTNVHYYTPDPRIMRPMDERYPDRAGWYVEKRPYLTEPVPQMSNTEGGGSMGNMGRGGGMGSNQNNSPSMNVTRDTREGRSPISRRNYMESKELHQDKATQMKELENYMQELSRDIIEMIEDATPEEKIMLQQKVSNLAAKIK